MKYQTQFKDYDVWIDWTPNGDDHDGIFSDYDKEEEAIYEARERYSLTKFRIIDI